MISHFCIYSAEAQKSLRDTGRVCAVDMGSNTLKLIVGEVKNGEYIQHLDIRKTGGVGDDIEASERKLKRKLISEPKLTEVLTILSGFQDECERQTKSRKLQGIATAAFREAENIQSVLQKFQETGVTIQVLTPEEESRYAYVSATLGEPGFAVLDLGSRTTEIVNEGDSTHEWVLLNTGYKVAWDDFYETSTTFEEASTKHLSALKKIVRDQDWKILQNQKELVVIEVGEAASYLLKIPQEQVEGKIITQTLLQEKLKMLRSMDAKAFADLKKSFKDAARVLPRAIFLELTLERTGYKSFRCTNRELNAAIILLMARSSTNTQK